MHWTELEAHLLPHIGLSPLGWGLTPSWPQSRWQPLPQRGPQTWIKRDDELSFGVSGTKFRKWLSLAQALRVRQTRHVLAWGSSRSSFLLGLRQFGAELGISSELFLLKSSPWRREGIDQLFQLWPEGALHWVERRDWPRVAELVAARELNWRCETGSDAVLTLKEGGAQKEALPGALTLALDIAAQEERLGIRLASIWIDAGSGFTAGALLLGLGLLGRRPQLEIVLCAGQAEEFEAGLEEQRKMLACQELLGLSLERRALPPYRLHRPPTARAFGSTNAGIFAEVRRAAQVEGLLLDPVYMAKLSLTERSMPSEEPRLLVHSGGGLSLFGYEF